MNLICSFADNLLIIDSIPNSPFYFVNGLFGLLLKLNATLLVRFQFDFNF